MVLILEQIFIKTDRLILRRFNENDINSFYVYRSNPEVAKFQSWQDYQYEEAQSFVEGQMNHHPNIQGSWFQFAVALAETNELIGDCALHTPAIEPRIVEIGFTLSPNFQGNGFATEAVHGLLNFIFQTLGKHKVTAFSDVRNKKSIAVLERVGMRREAHLLQNYYTKGKWVDEYQYSILKSEWERK